MAVVSHELDEAIVGLFVSVVGDEGISHRLECANVVLAVVLTHKLETNAAIEVDDCLLSLGELLDAGVEQSSVLGGCHAVAAF